MIACAPSIHRFLVEDDSHLFFFHLGLLANYIDQRSPQYIPRATTIVLTYLSILWTSRLRYDLRDDWSLVTREY